MTINSKTLQLFYGLVGITALVTTQIHALEYTAMGAINGTTAFWKDTLANASTRFITIDIMFLALAVTVWMLLEARRLKISIGWIYVLVGTFIGISFAMPIFLMHREIIMNKDAKKNSISGYLATSDLLYILGTILFAVTYTCISFN